MISDARGKVVQYKVPKSWLYDIADELRELPVGKHFDKAGTRVYPPRPSVNDRPDGY